MTQDEIIRMAREAGFSINDGIVMGGISDLKSFAALVAAYERAACAKVCGEMWAGGYGPSAITAAIQARGK